MRNPIRERLRVAVGIACILVCVVSLVLVILGIWECVPVVIFAAVAAIGVLRPRALGLVVLLLPTMGRAEVAGPPAPRSQQGLVTYARAQGGRAPTGPSLRGSMMIAGAGLTADIGTTAYGLTTPAFHETNPLGFAGGTAVATGATAAGVLVLHKTGHPKGARIAAWVICAAHVAFAVHNVRLIWEKE